MPDVPDQLTTALVGRYTIELELGRGGNATVYLARDVKHDRRVAIKVVVAEVAQSVKAERFLREIRIAAQLSHPRILTLYDSGEAAGFLYYVMPYVSGESLRDRLTREGQLSLPEALAIAEHVASALSYAHAQGVIHRDVKPENILLHGAEAVVADFGIARALTESVSGATVTETGVAVGTPAYMSPEQGAGHRDLDARSDVYSLACVLYEMLAGHPPFTGATSQEVLARHAMDPAPSVRAACPDVPPPVEAALRKALAKRRVDRFAGAAEFARALSAPAGAVPARWSRRRRAGVVLATAIVAVFGGWWTVTHGTRAPARDATWARTAGISTVLRLAEQGQADSAWTMARSLERIIPRDSAMRAVWPRIAQRVNIESDPSGVLVSRTSYAADIPWDTLGTTPLENVWIPNLISRLRLEKDGYAAAAYISQPNFFPIARFKLLPHGAVPAGMVYVPEGLSKIPAEDGIPSVKLHEYLIGQYEVTNAEFRKFVLAGGYGERKYWQEPFVNAGRPVRWEAAIASFVDLTGRPGPATWEGGAYPEGQDEYPVGGLSWYEAAAYARFAGKSLPTVYHWDKAAGLQNSAWVVPRSNFADRGPARVGSYRGISRYGSYDMAGNVREWCYNATGDARYIAGGGWNDAQSLFSPTFAASPWDRSPTNGLRVVQYLDPADPGPTADPLVRPRYDVTRERPVGDAIYTVYRRLFEYDPAPLDARLEAVDSSSPAWIRQRVSFAAAYGAERMQALLFLPRHAKAPYQTVVYFPSANAFFGRSSADIPVSPFDFIIQSGRAVVHPIYKDTYERGGGGGGALASQLPKTTNAYRDHVIMWAKDLRRSIDYAATRADLDVRRLAYYGFSWGGRLAPIMLAVEPRFKAAALNLAGFGMGPSIPEVDPLNYAPRVAVPVLLLSGRYDHLLPVETSARPFFRLLGTPPEHKRHVVAVGGHFIPRPDLIRETLDWLDRYLGPVQ